MCRSSLSAVGVLLVVTLIFALAHDVYSQNPPAPPPPPPGHAGPRVTVQFVVDGDMLAITDHQANKLYFYAADKGGYELKGTIDLSNVGAPRLVGKEAGPPSTRPK